MSLSPENQKIINDKNASRSLAIELGKRSEKIGNLLWRTTRKKKYNIERETVPNVIGVFRQMGSATKYKKRIKGGMIEDDDHEDPPLIPGQYIPPDELRRRIDMRLQREIVNESDNSESVYQWIREIEKETGLLVDTNALFENGRADDSVRGTIERMLYGTRNADMRHREFHWLIGGLKKHIELVPYIFK